jgi:hypothetical protein
VKKRLLVAIVAALLAATGALPAGAGSQETTDVLNQGGTGVYAEDGATLNRTPNGLRITVTVPTPAPGRYVYPAGAEIGHPEIFTLWAFVFNQPDQCVGDCDGGDFGGAAEVAVYNVAGHFSAGQSMTFTGHVGVGEASAGLGTLNNPEGAEVHVALAPHGGVSARALPQEFRSPAGSPVCGCWWVSLFK